VRRSVVLLFAVVALAFGSAGGVAAQSTGFGPPLARSNVDRRDGSKAPQIHVFYVVPSDGVDRHLDTDGTLANSVASFERWLAGQTGGKALRADTFHRSLDVTFFRLSETDGDVAAHGAFVREEIEAELQAAGFDRANKVYAVYYDGTSTFSCGGGAWPPQIPGTVAAMYLHGLPQGPIPCDTNQLAAAGAAPTYFDLGMLHEIMHTLGFVATCAPHEWRSGHVSDSANDLMWAGDTRWAPDGWDAVVLDFGHDDYYRAPGPGCLDLSDSRFLSHWR
jgi:hypothetical protein